MSLTCTVSCLGSSKQMFLHTNVYNKRLVRLPGIVKFVVNEVYLTNILQTLLYMTIPNKEQKLRGALRLKEMI